MPAKLVVSASALGLLAVAAGLCVVFSSEHSRISTHHNEILNAKEPQFAEPLDEGLYMHKGGRLQILHILGFIPEDEKGDYKGGGGQPPKVNVGKFLVNPSGWPNDVLPLPEVEKLYFRCNMNDPMGNSGPCSQAQSFWLSRYGGGPGIDMKRRKNMHDYIVTEQDTGYQDSNLQLARDHSQGDTPSRIQRIETSPSHPHARAGKQRVHPIPPPAAGDGPHLSPDQLAQLDLIQLDGG